MPLVTQTSAYLLYILHHGHCYWLRQPVYIHFCLHKHRAVFSEGGRGVSTVLHVQLFEWRKCVCLYDTSCCGDSGRLAGCVGGRESPTLPVIGAVEICRGS